MNSEIKGMEIGPIIVDELSIPTLTEYQVNQLKALAVDGFRVYPKDVSPGLVTSEAIAVMQKCIDELDQLKTLGLVEVGVSPHIPEHCQGLCITERGFLLFNEHSTRKPSIQ